MAADYGRKYMMRNRQLNAAMTIEMSILVPVVMFIIMGLIISVFYFHDKNILSGAAYEAAVTGSMEMREKKGVSEEELTNYVRERVRRKCIFLTYQQMNVTINEEEVIVDIKAKKRGFVVSVQKRAAITKPEKYIRDIRRLNIINGT